MGHGQVTQPRILGGLPTREPPMTGGQSTVMVRPLEGTITPPVRKLEHTETLARAPREAGRNRVPGFMPTMLTH